MTCFTGSCVIGSLATAVSCLSLFCFLLSAFCFLLSAFCFLLSASCSPRSLRTLGTLDALSPSLFYSRRFRALTVFVFLHLRLPTTSRLPARLVYWTTSACFQRNMPGTGLWSCSCLLAAPGGTFDLTSVRSMPKLRIKTRRWNGEVKCTCLVIVVGTPIPSVNVACGVCMGSSADVCASAF